MFSLKGVTFNEKDLPATLTNDEASISIAGMRCFPKEDLVSLNIDELNFAQKCRGKKPSQQQNIIPANMKAVFQKCLRYLNWLAKSHQ